MCRPHASEARRPGSRNPGRRRQQWKPEWGETRAARFDAKHESATDYLAGDAKILTLSRRKAQGALHGQLVVIRDFAHISRAIFVKYGLLWVLPEDARGDLRKIGYSQRSANFTGTLSRDDESRL